MNEDNMMRKAMRPIEKNRRTRSKPAKIRHLQKQQKLWMVSKVEWRKPGTKPGLAPSSFLLRTRLVPQRCLCTIDPWSRRAE
ncbi:MAG TPA: hypothetical protein VN478_05250 [Clostridia bacterium]|nr:hypothetical protein [Clostridia bacterium]